MGLGVFDEGEIPLARATIQEARRGRAGFGPSSPTSLAQDVRGEQRQIEEIEEGIDQAAFRYVWV